MAKEFSQADFEKAVDAVYQRIQLKKGTIRMKLQPQTPSGSLFDVVGQEKIFCLGTCDTGPT